jgi:hypothetical protein
VFILFLENIEAQIAVRSGAWDGPVNPLAAGVLGGLGRTGVSEECDCGYGAEVYAGLGHFSRGVIKHGCLRIKAGVGLN